ncbi:hypothetical protein [Streptosporangium roseum]|uniref:Uncharacterized protein n=1 Tax=Streptosporangium roseum (strain ATCC 12428 / DSM 43021 / JCM 3005 / KCTC 9067 / NCIMB 10171 / NRRL 2505 / NI 9100) TaxID=479432 RepID=D2AVJ1_STRRD|nr:hypothetical protein [Streptosporangium roseum]ACZ90637.1 hypothetical protein Sros_7982 [Streptosporangium roseum DSM 43021]
MSESRTATDRLRAELRELGVTGVYEVGNDGILSVWIGLVIRFRDGFYRWQEGPVKRRHLGTDPGGCAIRVARRYAELQADVPSWWEDLAKILRGDAAEDYP